MFGMHLNQLRRNVMAALVRNFSQIIRFSSQGVGNDRESACGISGGKQK
jgi:hypothetical protein